MKRDAVVAALRERALFCADIVATVAGIVAEIALDRGSARLPPLEG